MVRQRIDGPAGALSVIDGGEVDGGGTPALFIHGINGGAAHWLPLIERLAPHRRCVTFDLRGHGQSDKTGPFSEDDYMADVLAVLDGLSIGRVHLVGTSFGGCVAVRLAGKAADRVASLVALGSTLKPEGIDVDAAVEALHGAGVQNFFGQMLPAVSFKSGTDQAIIDESILLASTGRDEDLVEKVSRAAFSADLRGAAGDVSAPALVVAAEFDATCPVAQGEEMAKELGAELEVLAGLGHMAMVEDPDAVAARIEPFLRRHDN